MYFIKKQTDNLLLRAAALWQYTLFFSEKQYKSWLIPPNNFWINYELWYILLKLTGLQRRSTEQYDKKEKKKHQNTLTKEINRSTLQF